MKSIESQLKIIMKQLKHENPESRLKALDLLEQLKKEYEKGIEVDVLSELIGTAAGDFPEPIEAWEDPSYYIVDFVCDYHNEEIIDAIVKYYDGLSWLAKGRALHYLIEIDKNQSVSAYLDILERTMENGESPLFTEILMENLHIGERVVEKFYPYLKHDTYKHDLYVLIEYLHRQDVFYQFKKQEIYPILIEDYKKEISIYMEYQGSYSIQNVYGPWKQSYLPCRDKIEIYLSLIPYYFSEEVKKLIFEAMSFKDPMIKARAAIAALQTDVKVEDSVLLECSTNIESSELFHWELLRIRKEHVNPIKDRQAVVARTHLFYHILDTEDEPNIPKEITIVSYVDTHNNYGQPVRYYLGNVEIKDKQNMTAWIGAFALEEGEDSLYMWEGTYIDDIPFHDYSIEEHIEKFLKKRKMDKVELQNEIHFDYENKNNKLSIQGDTLFVKFSGENMSISLREIKKLTLETRKSGFLGFGKKEYIVIYNKQNHLVIEVPSNFIDYAELATHITNQTSHLKDPPFVEYLEYE